MSGRSCDLIGGAFLTCDRLPEFTGMYTYCCLVTFSIGLASTLIAVGVIGSSENTASELGLTNLLLIGLGSLLALSLGLICFIRRLANYVDTYHHTTTGPSPCLNRSLELGESINNLCIKDSDDLSESKHQVRNIFLSTVLCCIAGLLFLLGGAFVAGRPA